MRYVTTLANSLPRTKFPITFRTFFERTDPVEKMQRKELFTNNDLAITHNASFEEEFGLYPVLYVDFSASESNGCSLDRADWEKWPKERDRFNDARAFARVQERGY